MTYFSRKLSDGVREVRSSDVMLLVQDGRTNKVDVGDFVTAIQDLVKTDRHLTSFDVEGEWLTIGLSDGKRFKQRVPSDKIMSFENENGVFVLRTSDGSVFKARQKETQNKIVAFEAINGSLFIEQSDGTRLVARIPDVNYLTEVHLTDGILILKNKYSTPIMVDLRPLLDGIESGLQISEDMVSLKVGNVVSEYKIHEGKIEKYAGFDENGNLVKELRAYHEDKKLFIKKQSLTKVLSMRSVKDDSFKVTLAPGEYLIRVALDKTGLLNTHVNAPEYSYGRIVTTSSFVPITEPVTASVFDINLSVIQDGDFYLSYSKVKPEGGRVIVNEGSYVLIEKIV